MKKLFVTAIVLGAGVASQATIITRWDFNSYPSDGNSTTGVTTPVIGSGTANLVGTTATFARGAYDNTTSNYSLVNTILDPEDANNNNSGWNTTGYAADGVGSGTKGVEFMLSTVGFEDIKISFAQRMSNTASRFWRLDYTTDGSTWVNSNIYYDSDYAWVNGSGNPYYDRYADLSGIGAVENNANFGFRVLAVFQDEAVGVGDALYKAHGPTSTYGTSGTARFDMVTIEGTPEAVPEPATMAALGLGVAAFLGRRRRK